MMGRVVIQCKSIEMKFGFGPPFVENMLKQAKKEAPKSSDWISSHTATTFASTRKRRKPHINNIHTKQFKLRAY